MCSHTVTMEHEGRTEENVQELFPPEIKFRSWGLLESSFVHWAILLPLSLTSAIFLDKLNMYAYLFIKKCTQLCLFGGTLVFFTAKNKIQNYNVVSRNRIVSMYTGLYLWIWRQSNGWAVGYLPSLCATWSAATQKELCDPLSSGDISSDSTCLLCLYWRYSIRRQQYSRLLHTTLLMSNVMLDRMTSEVTSLWTGSQTEKTNQVILLQFDTTEIVIPE